MRKTMFLLTFMSLAACASTEESTDGGILDGAELTAFFAGNSYSYFGPDNKKLAEISYDADGTIRSTLMRDGKTYTGNWSVRGDTYCTSYEYRPDLRCFQVRATDTPGRFEDLANGKVDGYFVR